MPPTQPRHPFQTTEADLPELRLVESSHDRSIPSHSRDGHHSRHVTCVRGSSICRRDFTIAPLVVECDFCATWRLDGRCAERPQVECGQSGGWVRELSRSCGGDDRNRGVGNIQLDGSLGEPYGQRCQIRAECSSANPERTGVAFCPVVVLDMSIFEDRVMICMWYLSESTTKRTEYQKQSSRTLSLLSEKNPFQRLTVLLAAAARHSRFRPLDTVFSRPQYFSSITLAKL